MLAKDETIAIEVVYDQIVCDPATTVHKGRRVRWARYPTNAEFEFRLKFDRCTNSTSSATWPFQPPNPEPGNYTPWGAEFEGTIPAAAMSDACFKYTVEVRNAGTDVDSYDPMIIVGRG
jgi:hypothetical protein